MGGYVWGAYTPYEGTNELKINRVAGAGELPPTRGRGGQRQDTRGDPYKEENEVGAELCVDTGMLGFRDPHRMCVF